MRLVGEAGETYPVGALLAVLGDPGTDAAEIDAFVGSFKGADASFAGMERDEPEPVKAKLEKAVETILAKQSLRDRLAKLDITPDFIAGPALQAKLVSEIQNWTRFIDAKGIKAE